MVGPMRAARRFVETPGREGLAPPGGTDSYRAFGSLRATGKGHGSDKAILLGLEGATPELVDIEAIEQCLVTIRCN